MAFPTFILGGAPKCATSSVHRWLVTQPGVRGADRKETFYLMDPGHPLADPVHNLQREGTSGYARLFPGADVAPHRVDSTTHYLYQDAALRVLADLPTRPKVVFLLREPAMRALSSFRFSQQTLGVVDPELDFTSFVELVDSRPELLHRHVKSAGSRFVLARDLSYGRYVDYVERYVERLGRERVLVLLTENLRDRPRETLALLASFAGLSVEPSRLVLPERANETFTMRHPGLHTMATALRTRLRLSPLMREFAKDSYWRIQRRDDAGEISERDLRTVATLRRRYEETNRRLGALLDIDVSPWERDARGPIATP